jgi:hypothetical protein
MRLQRKAVRTGEMVESVCNMQNRTGTQVSQVGLFNNLNLYSGGIQGIILK